LKPAFTFTFGRITFCALILTRNAPQSIPFRLAAIDIDGTLLGPDSQMSAENMAAVGSLREHGVRVVLASGRRHENMLRFYHQLQLDEPLVSCQGSLVKNEKTGRILHRHPIPAGLAAEAVHDGLAEGMTIIYYQMNGIYISESNSFTDLYHARGGDPLIEGTLKDLTGETPLKIIWINAAEKIAARLPGIRTRYHGRLETVVTYPEYLEFIDMGVSKAVGIAAIADEYGIDRNEVLAFGDGDNDVSMLEWAGHGVAMSKSSAAAKAAAGMVASPGDPATSLARAISGILAQTLK
jgi:Cof subfamily protein (haloacid dehalogenase superfamily)